MPRHRDVAARPRGRSRSVASALVAAASVAIALTACEPNTVSVGFRPEVGDEYRFHATIDTEVVRTIEGRADETASAASLDATQRVVAVDDDGVRVEVTVTRDGTAPNTFEVRLDRASRLTTIDLVEGVPAEALGLDLGADLPADIASPPEGPLTPGVRWSIEEPIELEGVGVALLVSGQGRIESLGVEDGVEVAVAVVDLVVPVRSVVDTDDGRVTLFGTQTASSRTAYDLGNGTVHRDRTVIEGRVSVIVEPPDGVDVTPLEGAIEYSVRTETRRRT